MNETGRKPFKTTGWQAGRDQAATIDSGLALIQYLMY